MFAVRYVALAALVFWVGGMLVLLLSGAESAELLRFVHRISLVCGGLILFSLVVIKFIGPPPPAFFLRAGIVAAMLAIAIGAGLPAARAFSTPLTAVNAVAGLFLLSFYARE